ncbi:hypothetical protein O181_130411 [Austropuccinia psidii MF-1]|uniref:Uncharacterized protein n=1 Tax=Austropuccinia psidii MF-1 TaxID=1389203 RepID=A0A9Q3L2R5_9BASI|nr:hypothetical protein [Austropuccinia psidii MF-1]
MPPTPLTIHPQDETTMLPPSPPSQLLTLPPPLLAILALLRRPQDIPPTLPSTLFMPPHPHHLPRFRITSIVYSGLLAYTINTIKEIC